MFEPCYFSVLPSNVRYDDSLCPNEKLLFSEISSLCNKNGYCFANNEYFAKLYKVHKNTVSKWISHLKEKKYIKLLFTYKENSKAIDKRILTIGESAFSPNMQDNLFEDDSLSILEEQQVTDDKSVESVEEEHQLEDEVDEKKCHTSKRKAEYPLNEKLKDNNIKFNNSNIDRSVYTDFEKKFKTPITPITKNLLDQFLLIYPKNIITHAMDIAIKNGVPKISYVAGIIKKWKEANYKTLDDVIRASPVIPDFTEEELKALDEILSWNWFEEGEEGG